MCLSSLSTCLWAAEQPVGCKQWSTSGTKTHGRRYIYGNKIIWDSGMTKRLHPYSKYAWTHLYLSNWRGYCSQSYSHVSNQRHTSELLPGLSEQNWLADRNVSLRAPNAFFYITGVSISISIWYWHLQSSAGQCLYLILFNESLNY